MKDHGEDNTKCSIKSVGECNTVWQTAVFQRLSRAILDLALVDLLYKRYSNVTIERQRSDARHFF